jgi:peptidoglycan/LPS O-acetylase OafA/YrhL
MSVDQQSARGSVPRPTDGGTRWDIQGLRAFAVLAVVLYHLWPLRLPGGFVGVDVFFVISGYLITSHLIREVEHRGRIGLGAFWSRRAKRLLPAAFIVIVTTGSAVLAFAPLSLWGQYFRELMAATVYVQNWQLAGDSVDYLASSNDPSPFQHFWSLSVEEQFYIALPLVVTAALVVARRAGRSPRVLIRATLAAVVVLSFTWCLVQTTTSPGVAYFSTLTRAWEFALGGLAATVSLAALSQLGRTVPVVAAWAGAGALLLSLWVIDPDTAFPGWAAALPVIGAVLVVTFGGTTDLSALGRTAPAAFLGRISYSLYLWHWPIVVLVPLVSRHPLTTVEKLGVLAVSLGLAAVTTVLVEEPLRFSGMFKAMRPRRVAVLGIVATGAVLSLGAGSLVSLDRQEQRSAEAAAAVLEDAPQCFGAASLISSPTPCVDPELASVRVPAPAQVVNDDDNRPECWSNDSADLNVCQLGPKTGYTKRLLAIGDSHNNNYVGAYEKIAEAKNWRIDVAGHRSCYWTSAVQASASQDLTEQCAGWKEAASAYVAAQTDLDAVIVTHSTTNSQVLPVEGEPVEKTIVDGMVEAWSATNSTGVPVLAIWDNPRARDDVVACVALMEGPTTSECDRTHDNALKYFDGQEEALAQHGLGALIDVNDLICTDTSCPAVIGGVVVYRDPTHLTGTFARTLAPALGDRMEASLQELGR